MTWFYVDDNLADHRKVRRLGKDKLAAMGLWTLCGTWSARTGSDGFIPHDVVQSSDPREKMAARLIEVGLWKQAELDGERGYRFHDWSGATGWQKTAEQRAAEKDARSRAGRIGGQRSAEARRQARATADAQANASPPATANGAAPAQANPKQTSTPPHPYPSTSYGATNARARDATPRPSTTDQRAMAVQALKSRFPDQHPEISA